MKWIVVLIGLHGQQVDQQNFANTFYNSKVECVAAADTINWIAAKVSAGVPRETRAECHLSDDMT